MNRVICESKNLMHELKSAPSFPLSLSSQKEMYTAGHKREKKREGEAKKTWSDTFIKTDGLSPRC